MVFVSPRVCLSDSSNGPRMAIDDSHVRRVVHVVNVRFAQYLLQILRFVGYCMYFAWWRHFRLQFFFDVHAFFAPFRRRRGGTELQLAARIIFALLRRAVRKQIASRREQYKTVGGEPRTRGKFLS